MSCIALCSVVFCCAVLCCVVLSCYVGLLSMRVFAAARAREQSEPTRRTERARTEVEPMHSLSLSFPPTQFGRAAFAYTRARSLPPPKAPFRLHSASISISIRRPAARTPLPGFIAPPTSSLRVQDAAAATHNKPARRHPTLTPSTTTTTTTTNLKPPRSRSLSLARAAHAMRPIRAHLAPA